MKYWIIVLSVAILPGLNGCAKTARNAYYGMWGKLGYEKRDILVERVIKARDEQNQAKEEFKTTLEKFQELTGFKGGELEAKYKKLNSAYEDCEAKVKAVGSRIDKVETVAGDMFDGWQKEIGQYQSEELKRSSQVKLTATKDRYATLIKAMRNSESKMKPVLAAFHDQVLYLKHNLNAQAISSLQATASGIESDVQNLIREMEASIAEANAFVKDLKGEGG